VPKKLTALNTSGQEMFPYINTDELFFSSNGRDGFGGLDIYSVSLSDPTNTIKHLPSPINSRSDDFGLIFTSGELGWMNSDRGHNGLDRVYKVRKEEGRIGCNAECDNDACRNFKIDGLTDMSPERYVFYWDFGDGQTEENWFPSHCYSDTGEYLVTLSVFDIITGYYDSNVVTQTIHIETLAANNPSFSLPAAKQSQLITPITDGVFEGVNPENILWKSSAGDYLFGNSPTFTFDSVGWNWVEQNVQIEQGEGCCYKAFRRYVYVFPSIVSNLESPNFSDLLGNGSSTTLPNSYKTIIDFEGTVENEPILLTISDNEGVAFDTIIRVDSIQLQLIHQNNYVLRAKNALGVTIELKLSSEQKTEVEYSHYLAIFPPLKLERVHFDVGSAAIRKEAAQDLDELVQIMLEYPTLEIALSAHTDSRGGNAANLQLSERRARSVENYLIDKGISRSRVQSKGFGENQLVNGCSDGVNCSDAQHQENRRVEAKIVTL
jgi:outer membrane protein OmpA-like peptidoglycan-associated protein